jgi:hypothetical protein
LSYSAIANDFGVSRQAVHAWCKKHQKEPNEYLSAHRNISTKHGQPIAKSKTAMRHFVLEAVHKFDFTHWLNIAQNKHTRHFANADFEFVFQIFRTAERQIRMLGQQEQKKYADFLSLVEKKPLPETPDAMRDWILRVSQSPTTITVAASSVVYAIKAQTGRIKIGMTFGPIEKRFMALQSASPVSLQLLFSMQCANAPLAEKEVHRKLGSQRSHGEWFDVSEEEAIQTIKTVCNELFG